MAFYLRPSRIDEVDAEALFRLHRESMEWLTRYFEVPYPFEKLDFVLTPGFPYGGMEHPGAIFYRETALAFESTPTARDLLRRSTLIYHEASHMWFGDLVTMKWFDDLWLKEGYATFMSYKLLEALQPETLAWKRFSQNVEPRAYRVELTRGTTPVYQALENLAHAKSAYGAIVYNKAPAVLRQLEFLIGDEAFRKSASLFLMRHAYANASWADLVRCCEEVSGRRLGDWSDAWILRMGMPMVTVAFPPAGGVTLVQEGVHDGEAVWPFKTRLAAGYEDGSIVEIDVKIEERETFVDMETPAFVFANASDFAYGRFPLDEKSLEAVLVGLDEIVDPFLKSLLYDTLWDMVMAGELAPVRYISLALESVIADGDPLDCTVFLNNMEQALQLYLSRAQAEEWGPLVERRLEQIMDNASADAALRLTCFRSYMDLASTEKGLDRLAAMLAGDRIPPDVTLAPSDRWRIIKQLIVKEHEGANTLFDEETASDRSVDAMRYRFETRSAFPEVKEEYFGYYNEETAYAESWLEASLDGFNTTRQQALTLPYLERALAMSPWLKEHRKIFFLPRWLDSFIASRTSRAAAEVVNGFLKERKDLPRDIVLKIYQSLDPLEDTIRIRETYAGE
jgi:aminopeptidase N